MCNISCFLCFRTGTCALVLFLHTSAGNVHVFQSDSAQYCAFVSGNQREGVVYEIENGRAHGEGVGVERKGAKAETSRAETGAATSRANVA